MTRTITTLRNQFNEYGYAIEIDFVQSNHDQGGVTYEIMMKERWQDGHITLPSHHYKKIRNKEAGNAEYKKYLSNGFAFICKTTFDPVDVDMR